MSVTITGAGAHTPEVVDGYKSARESQNIVHALLGGGESVTLRAAASRSGTLKAVFANLAAAEALRAELSQPQTLTLADPDNPSINMTFIVTDSSEVELEERTREIAFVNFTFREVTP